MYVCAFIPVYTCTDMYSPSHNDSVLYGVCTLFFSFNVVNNLYFLSIYLLFWCQGQRQGLGQQVSDFPLSPVSSPLYGCILFANREPCLCNYILYFDHIYIINA